MRGVVYISFRRDFAGTKSLLTLLGSPALSEPPPQPSPRRLKAAQGVRQCKCTLAAFPNAARFSTPTVCCRPAGCADRVFVPDAAVRSEDAPSAAERKAEGTHTLCIGLPEHAPLVVRVFHQFEGAKVSFSKRRRRPRLADAKLCGHLNEGRRSQAGLWADPGELPHNKHERRHKMCRDCPSQGSRRAPTSRAVCIVRVKGEA